MRSEPGRAPLALHVVGACKRLGDRHVLRDVSIEVARGSLLAVVGPNGAGKSSLVRAIAGRLQLDAGAVHIAGLEGAAARRAGRLGLVPQDIALSPHLTVVQNLRLWAALAGVGRRQLDRRIGDGLAWAGLGDRAHARVEQLSGGMRRRANLVAGLLHEPAVLLLDEPLVGIDAESRDRVHAVLRDARARDMGIVLVTHDVDDVASLCDRVAILADGAIVAEDTVEGLMARFAPPPGEVEVVLQTAPSDPTRLMAEGFSSITPLEWVARSGVSTRDLGGVDARLEALGLATAEIRWRRPTLSRAVAEALRIRRAAA